jgi:hypothetical protein
VSVRSFDRRKLRPVAFALVLGWLVPAAGHAYTAAGDRNFPATIILPQVAPSDALYGNAAALPFDARRPGDPTLMSDFSPTYSKTITERLGIQIEGYFERLDRLHAPSSNGLQNAALLLQYEPILDRDHEFVLTLGVGRELGGTGTRNVGAPRQGATTPEVFFAKGLGDLDIGYWRPLAVTGVAGYQFGDSSPRPDLYQAGFSVQYSIPYLGSKVAAVELPDFIRNLTPLTEVFFAGPAGRSFGQRATALVAPGVSYSNGRGWEFAIEALLPTTRATGSGIGVTAQLVLQLDYLLPGTALGRPLFPAR